MSTMTAVAKLEAVREQRAVPLTTVRHHHLSERPFVFIPLTLAGEACAPLAAMLGSDRDAPVLLTVAQPRNRAQRFRFAEQLADCLLPYLASCRNETETYYSGRPSQLRERYTTAPQILVPNPAGIAFTRLLGRSTRLRRTEGPFAVAPSVPELGKWLTWFADSGEFPGSCLLLAMTRMLTDHWATGQSGTEDANLSALMAWIDPPDGLTGAEAALQAEDPARCPPAGPATDPRFDETLHRLMTDHDTATGARREALARLIDRELHSQLRPTWDLMWRAVDLLRTLPEGAHVAGRWEYDRASFTDFAQYLDEGGAPQARRDHAARAARRLARLEEAVARYQTERAFDDPLVMAEYELTGEAFTGTVVARDAERMIDGGRSRLFRPMVTVRSAARFRPEAGASLVSPARPTQTGHVLAVRDAGAGEWEMDLQLSGGLANRRRPPAAPGTVPELGEEVCYCTFGSYITSAPVPDEEETPWTHGGPPEPYQPTDDDAEEAWQT